MSEKFEINTIKIKSFRGIVDYELEKSKKSLVLCGENGSGKSSIVNAFEYLFTGKVDSLSGSREINHSKSLINITGDKNDVYVEALTANIACIFVTFDVSKLLKSNVVIDKLSQNI